LLYLKSKEKGWFAFRAYVDSGADISLFMRGDSRLLGLDLYEGEYRPIVGIGKILIPAYVHNVEVRIVKQFLKPTLHLLIPTKCRGFSEEWMFSKIKITFDELNLQTIFETHEQ